MIMKILLKSLKVDNEYYKKKYKRSSKKKIILNITDKLIGSAWTIISSTLSILIPGVQIISSSSALLISIAILLTNDYISEIRTRYTKLSVWIIIITLLWRTFLKRSLTDKKIHDKEAKKGRKIFNQYVD